jgi:ankyrin repeat protein
MENIIKLINKNKWTDAIKLLNNDYENIIDGNNILHFACIRGNEKIINKIIKNETNEIYKSNDDNNTCCHLLAINMFDDILIKIIKKYPKYLKLLNGKNELIIHLVIDRIKIFENILDVMIKNNYIDELNTINDNNMNILLMILTVLKKEKKKEYIKCLYKLFKVKINLDIPNKNIPLFFCINNNLFAYAKMLIINGANVNLLNGNKISLLNIVSLINNIKLIKLIIKKNGDVNYGGLNNSYLPINTALKNSFWEQLDILIESNLIDFNQQDNLYYIPLHYAITAYLKQNMPEKLLEKIIDKTDKNTINIKCIDKDKTTQKIIYEISKQSTKEININYPKIEEINYGLFNSDIIHNIIYTTYLLNTYENLTTCVCENTKENIDNYKMICDFEKYLITTSTEETINFYIERYIQICYSLITHIIIWKNKDNYYMHNDFEKYLTISLNNKKRFIYIKLTLITDNNGLHANSILFDKYTNTLRRFEPYGDWKFMDGSVLDKMIHDIFIKCSKNTNIKFINIGDYMKDIKLQLFSGDHIIENKNLGDPNGYCVAWSFWFIELKLKNPDVDDKKLIEQIFENIISENKKNPLLSYIRNYAVNLNAEKNKILEKLKIDNNNLYNIEFNEDDIKKIVNFNKQYYNNIFYNSK